jgi:hypothetical protein
VIWLALICKHKIQRKYKQDIKKTTNSLFNIFLSNHLVQVFRANINATDRTEDASVEPLIDTAFVEGMITSINCANFCVRHYLFLTDRTVIVHWRV